MKIIQGGHNVLVLQVLQFGQGLVEFRQLHFLMTRPKDAQDKASKLVSISQRTTSEEFRQNDILYPLHPL